MGLTATKEIACDLDMEKLEEIRMLTQLSIPEIKKLRLKYLGWSPEDKMTKDEFNRIPAISVNPLRDRLFNLFDLSPEGTVSFKDFVVIITVFTYQSSRDSKLRLSFKLQDLDGDGKLSKSDLLEYMKLVVDFGDTMTQEEIEKNMDILATRTLEEASSDPSGEFLSYEDYVKVVTTTDDFDTKMLMDIL